LRRYFESCLLAEQTEDRAHQHVQFENIELLAAEKAPEASLQQHGCKKVEEKIWEEIFYEKFRRGDQRENADQQCHDWGQQIQQLLIAHPEEVRGGKVTEPLSQGKSAAEHRILDTH